MLNDLDTIQEVIDNIRQYSDKKGGSLITSDAEKLRNDFLSQSIEIELNAELHVKSLREWLTILIENSLDVTNASLLHKKLLANGIKVFNHRSKGLCIGIAKSSPLLLKFANTDWEPAANKLGGKLNHPIRLHESLVVKAITFSLQALLAPINCKQEALQHAVL